jgi:hypothetical protein
MSLGELLASLYVWADAHAPHVLAAAALLPAGGTFAAWVGKQGRTDQDGRVLASAVVGLAILFAVAVLTAGAIAVAAFDRSLLEANVLLLAAPIVCLAGALLGMRLVFPLGALSSVRTAADIGIFLVACAAALWLLSRFRGWGVIFFGGLAQLATIAIFTWLLLRRLYRRAFGGTPT